MHFFVARWEGFATFRLSAATNPNQSNTMTTTIPTDKYGTAYYGATTLAEALERASLVSDDCDTIEERDEALREYAAELRGHGYTGVAARLLKHYDLKG